MHGQALMEYTIILMLAVIILVIPWGGNPPPIEQLVDAFRQFYLDYSWNMSLP
jgi:hypothetical protein